MWNILISMLLQLMTLQIKPDQSVEAVGTRCMTSSNVPVFSHIAQVPTILLYYTNYYYNTA